MNIPCYIKKRPLLWIVLLICALAGGLYFGFVQNSQVQKGTNDIIVKRTWELPDELNEISGIAYLSENEIACVQDELGTIFIFDISEEKIAQKIHFGKKGDYEGITIVGKTAFVLRSDGTLFEVVDFNAENGPTNVAIYNSPFPKKYDFEGLAYEKSKNRLLLSVKEIKKEKLDYREIHAFDLRTKSFEKGPVFKLKFPFENKGDKFRPSEIELGDDGMYVLISKKPAIVRYEGEIPKTVFRLNKKQFPQPEGLTFGPKGEIFLSSEGSPGKLVQIELKEK